MASRPNQLRLKINSDAQLYVESPNEDAIGIHPIWLRERCQDAKSMDPMTGQRLLDPSDLDLSLCYAAFPTSKPGVLRVRFSDDHEAEFTESDILSEAAMSPGDYGCPEPHLWNAQLAELPRARWHEHPDDTLVTQWLETFFRYGFLIFGGVPTEPDALLKVASTFGWPRETNFGLTFDVQSKPTGEANDLGYTPIKLDPHTDNPYRSPVPGVQLLHCLANETTGGLSTLVDGYAVAQSLRNRDPDAFRILSTTFVRFRFRDRSTELLSSAPPIELDARGSVRTIRFSPRLDFVPLLPRDDLTVYYRARRAFDYALRSPEFEIRFMLEQGDLVMFDNCRLLHGRTSFDPRQGLRHLKGCYIDIDGPRSRFRMSQRAATAAGNAHE